MHQHFDYIISGTGCAGLSLAMHMIQSGRFEQKKVLLVDEAPKNKNDRTWCFWEQEESLFEPIVFRQWNQLWFYGEGFSKELSLEPYTYKMIRGIDFYEYCLAEISKHNNFQFRYGKVENLFSDKETGIVVDGEKITCEYVFNSILFQKPQLKKNEHWLLQHFKGWVVQTDKPSFAKHSATLMDFRISQKHGTAFCYVLPHSEKEALVEYTLFTPSLLQQEEYDQELKQYVEDILAVKDYRIAETEFGIIPMTNHQFQSRQNRIIHIGTAGGQTKGSSGYTFYFIQKHSKAIVERLSKTGQPIVAKPSSRFHFYDSVLLHILQYNTLPGKQIFSTLFRKNKPSNVLTFLNNESSLAEELKIISSLPTLPFLKAAIKQNL
ncbi:MAG: lycopene cyclase [Chitinophagaceae bacterium]|nr:MAG: lycopene cyclase [Chitinophagaceae bacterium]